MHSSNHTYSHLPWRITGLLCLILHGTTLISTGQGGETPMAFTLSSAAFQNGSAIPKKYTCDGADISPALSWEGVPAGTKTISLIADDPDAPAGTWTHWVLFDLPASTKSLPENVPRVDRLKERGTQGRNDFRNIGYGGPCPPPGKLHRYFFKLYALDSSLDLQPGISKAELERRMDGHIVGKAELIGTYKR